MAPQVSTTVSLWSHPGVTKENKNVQDECFLATNMSVELSLLPNSLLLLANVKLSVVGGTRHRLSIVHENKLGHPTHPKAAS